MDCQVGKQYTENQINLPNEGSIISKFYIDVCFESIVEKDTDKEHVVALTELLKKCGFAFQSLFPNILWSH